ncbi:MAG TPA: DUF6600 domain-containing protein [Candidatus Acidoferrum sp.]|nr:DUF6600 domain-containing protein [Candidatus Acidoferrum sp.]
MRKQLLKWMSLISVVLAVYLFAPQRAAADDNDDPPSRVARLAYARGNISFNPAGTDDWVTAVVNRPITTGDKLWSDENSRAELHLGYAVIRLSDHTGFSFLNLTDEVTQLRLTEGTLNIHVRRLGDDETFEVDTPNLALSILRPGSYRINVNEAGDATIVAVREGQGEITGGGSAYTIHAREEGFFNGLDQLDADIQRYQGDQDDFDQWCYDRDRRAEHSASARYVSDDVVGYEDLDEYGGWRPVPEYGNVWFPHTTVVGWAPYRYGHWVWISPWGWTWVDDAPWGFAPFHYGRWVVVGGVWGWVPSPPRAVVGVAYVRPVYAPALVAWVGGRNWGVGVVAGGPPAAGVAWFPLGPRDVYCPSYHVSERYVERVNVSNTTIINRVQVTNVYNNVYVNKTVNVTNVTYQNQTQVNAVTATSRETFVSAGSVHNNMIRVNAKEVTAAPVAPMTPAVAPQQRSVVGGGVEARVRPPSPVLSRPVVAKTAPPPAPVAFTKQQQIVQENGGRPPAISEMRRVQQQQENAQVERPSIRMAPPVRQGPPQNARDNRPDVQQGNPNRQGPPSNVTQPNQQGQGQNVQNNRQDVQQGNSNRPANANPGNANQTGTTNNSNQPGQTSRPGNVPANQGNAPANQGNQRGYNDRPPSSRPTNPGNSNPQLEQKQQQQLQDLRLKQDQERQRIEQQQVQQRQKLDQNSSNAQRPPQVDQRQQPQNDQRKQVEQNSSNAQRPPQVDQRPQPQADERERQADQRQQQADQRQRQLEQKQQDQLQRLEQKHDQQQQKLEQKQQVERQRQEKPAKQDKPPKQDKPSKQDKKDDKPHH